MMNALERLCKVLLPVWIFLNVCLCFGVLVLVGHRKHVPPNSV